jgi:S1-C subfamily serine protease
VNDGHEGSSGELPTNDGATGGSDTSPYGYRVPPPMPPTPPPSSPYQMGAPVGSPMIPRPSVLGAGTPHWGVPPAPPAVQPPSHRLRNGILVTAAAVIALGAGIGIGHSAWQKVITPHTNAPSSNGNPLNSPFSFGGGSGGSNSSTANGPKDVSSIADKVDPGLVDIDTSLGYQQEEAAGTGIVLTPNGEILTNNHVIDGATTISVTDVGNGNTYSASVVGYDRHQDIAILQLHNASNLKTAEIGNSSSAAVGEDVVGIGNAGGTGGTPSAAGGTITALGQSITASDSGDGTSEQLTNLIETNADIQAGDSGGSLVNTSGEVVGIDTAASAGFSFSSQGGNASQGYAIPINEALSVAKSIEAGDASSTVHIGATGFLGVEIDAAPTYGNSGYPYGGNAYGNGSTGSGAVVAGAITSSPAQEAGLSQGDIITAVNGKSVTDPESLTDLLEPYHPGDKVKITWTDTSNETHTSTIQLTSGPPQ